MRISILVVSRTPELLNRLLASLDRACSDSPDAVEILCSWNGSAEDEAGIRPGRLPFAVVQRDPYHFASNMNGLAARSRGHVLVLANDDLIADPGSIDSALERLEQRSDVGLVGARLRRSDGTLTHAGMHFRPSGEPYHPLNGQLPADHPWAMRERPVPCLTGAFLAIHRDDYRRLQLAESFLTCGEDVLLSLQVRTLLGRTVLYCPAMSGVHDEKSTRGQLQQDREEDRLRMVAGWTEARQQLSREQILEDLRCLQEEAEVLGTLNALARELPGLRRERDEALASLHQLQAAQARAELEADLHQREVQRLRSRILQLENQLARHGLPV